MATRFYLGNSTAAPTSPTVRSDWERSIAAFARHKLSRTKTNSALTDVAALMGSTATSQTCWHQWVSDPLPSNITIAGTTSLVIRGLEGAIAEDAHLAFMLRVMQGDSTTLERGLLCSVMATSTEFTTTAQTRIHSAIANSSVNALAGDRIVLEVGIHAVTAGNTTNITLRFGDPSATADFALTSGLTTDLVPWVELSDNVFLTTSSVSATGNTVALKGTDNVVSASTNKASLKAINTVLTMTGNKAALKTTNLVRTITGDTVALTKTVVKTTTGNTASLDVAAGGTDIQVTTTGNTAAVKKLGLTSVASSNTVALKAAGITKTASTNTAAVKKLGLVRTATGDTVALKAVALIKTALATAALKKTGLIRAITSDTAALRQVDLVKTATSTAALKSVNLVKTATSTASIKRTNLVITLTGNTVALRATATRTAISRVALKATIVKSVSAKVALLGISQRSAVSSTALKALNRTVTASTNTASILGGGTSFVQATNNSAALKQLARVQSIGPNNVALKSTSIRSVGAAAALRASVQKAASSSAALKSVGAVRQIPALVALRHTRLLACPSNVDLKTVNTKSIASSVALRAIGLNKVIGAKAALQTTDNMAQVTGVSVALSLFGINTVSLSVSGNTAFVAPSTSVIQTLVGVRSPIDIGFTITPFDPVRGSMVVRGPIDIIFKVESA